MCDICWFQMHANGPNCMRASDWNYQMRTNKIKHVQVDQITHARKAKDACKQGFGHA